MAPKETEVIVNINNSLINCDKYEHKAVEAINNFDMATNEDSANQATIKLVALKKKGVIFPSNLTFIKAKRVCSRLPSQKTLQAIPGYNDIYSFINEHWPKINNAVILAFFKRIMLNLFLCNDANNLLDINPETWKLIIDSWRDDDTSFNKLFGTSKHRPHILKQIAEAYSAINNDHAYKKLLGRKPRRGRLGDYSGDYLVKNPTEETSVWTKLFLKWLNNQNLKTTTKQNRAFKLLIDWLANYPLHLTQSPIVFLSELRYNPSIFEFGGNEKAYEIGIIFRFTNWIIDEHMVDSSEEEDGVVLLGYPIITANEASLLKQNLPVRPVESTSIALPTRWRLKLADILTEDNFAWPKSLANQYFLWTDPETGLGEQVWVPTLTYLFLTMLEIPLRRIQVLCLDSGEGDLVLYDQVTSKWIENTGKMAGYWKRHPEARVVNRGVIRKAGTADKPTVGFYINTNKTQDKNAPSGELTGYFIPWQNEDVIKLLTDLRKWQQKYNPVKAPTPLSEIDCKAVFQQKPTETSFKETVDRFYLFRSPLASSGYNPYSPPTYDHCRKFWLLLLAKLEEVLNNNGDDVKIIERRNEVNGQPEESVYNIHGLRVATLTAMAEVGVPIEVLSKILAGHSSILMTIYYLKFDAAAISATIKGAGKKTRENEAESYRTWIESKSFDEAAKLVVYADEEAFRSLMKSKLLPIWSNEGYGVCPNAGTRCADGGPLLQKLSDRASVYDAVPGGSHNCLRCRHFITGTAFLLQISMKTNKLFADAHKLSVMVNDMLLELEDLENKKFLLAKNGNKDAITGAMISRIKQLETSHESSSILLNETLYNAHAAYRFTDGIKRLIDSDDNTENKLPALLASDENITLNFKETTRFEQISHIISASHLFPFLKDDNYEMEQEQFLDVVLMRENLKPLCLMPLTKHQKRMAAEAAADHLLTNVGVEETQQIYEGKITLQGLGFNPTLLPIAMEEAVPMLLSAGRQEVING